MATNFNTVVTSEATNSQITSEGNKSLITRGYAEEFYSGGGGGSTGVAYFLQATGGSGTQVITNSATSIEIDTADFISNPSHFTLASNGQITIANAGTYFIGYTVDADQTSGGARQMTVTRLETNGGSGSTFTEIDGSRGSAYSRNAGDESEAIHRGGSIVTLSAGEIIRVTANKSTSDETITALLDKCSIQIMSITASVGLSSETNTSSSGALAIDLTNIGGTYYTSQRSSGSLSIASNPIAGGFAHLRLTYGSEPSVTGATKMAGATYDTSGGAEMKMVVYNDGSASYYYFLEI